jgi:predicted RND superfamily exporter protein
MRYDPINLRSALMAENNGDIAKMLGGNFILYGNHLFSSDTTVALVFVSPNFISFDSKGSIRLVDKIQRSIKQLESVYPDVEVLLHGPPVQTVFNSRQIKQDLVLTVGISLLFSCLLIMISFRNKSTLPMLLLPVVYGAFLALACMFLLQDMMSLMALGIGAIVLGVALSYCLHVITHFKYLTDPERVLQDQVRPVLLGGLTTIGAFMGLLFTESAILRDFGWFVSFAMAGTTISCLVFLPQLFPYIKNIRLKKAFTVFEKINSYPLDRHYWLLILIVALFVIGLFTQSKVQFDANLRNIGYFDPIVTRSMDLFAEKTSTGYTTSYYAATSVNLDSAYVSNKRISAVCDSLQAEGMIFSYTKSATILLPKAEQEKRIATWKAYWDEERVNQLKKNVIAAGEANRFRPAMFDPFFELITKDYEPASLYEAGVLPEGIMANLIENSQGMYLIYTAVQLNSEDLKTVNDLLASEPNVIVCDPFYYTTNMVEMMNKDFNTILGISSIFVLLCLFVVLRSIPLTIIAFLPMGMSWYIVLGVMAMLGLQFNLINIIISTFIFGIGVDYSIYIMEGLLSDVKKYDQKLMMYHKTAIFLSAVVLIISICSLMFAKHPALSSIGMATLIGMTSTILTVYSLQPFLFKQLMKTRYGDKLRKKYERK